MPKLLKKRGGARPGSGQKPIGASRRIIKTIALEQRLWDAIEAYRTQAGLSRNGAVHKLLSDRLLSVQKPLIDAPAPPADDLALALANVDAEPELTPRPSLAPCLDDWLAITDLDFGQRLSNEIEYKGFKEKEKENDFPRKVSDFLSRIYGNVLVNFLVSHETGLTKDTYSKLKDLNEPDRRRALLDLAGIDL